MAGAWDTLLQGEWLRARFCHVRTWRAGACALDGHPARTLIDERLSAQIPYRVIQEEILRLEPPVPPVTATNLSLHRGHTVGYRSASPTVRHVERAPTTLEDMRRALADLEAGHIDHDAALAVVWRDDRPLYQRPDFRKLRARRIESVCSQCGTKVGPFVLQHLRQPLDFRWALDLARRDARRSYEALHARPTFDDLPQVETPVCSRCGRAGFYRRITKALPYRCAYRDCGHEFSEPGVRREPDPSLAGQRWSTYVAAFEAECAPTYKHVAAAEYLRSRISYLEGDHVTTLCKKCAYLADEHGMVLCQCCGQHYHARRYPTCWTCKQLPAAHGHSGASPLLPKVD